MWAKTLLLLLSLTSFFTIDTFKQDTRERYVKSLASKKEAEKLLQTLALKEQTPFVIGYSGATKMMMAKHFFNPFLKISYFNAGKKQLQEAIARDKNNVELVFLRYATQVSAPAILGYTQDLVADKKIILKELYRQNLDEKLVKTIVAFIKRQKLSIEEQQLLLNNNK